MRHWLRRCPPPAIGRTPPFGICGHLRNLCTNPRPRTSRDEVGESRASCRGPCHSMSGCRLQRGVLSFSGDRAGAGVWWASISKLAVCCCRAESGGMGGLLEERGGERMGGPKWAKEVPSPMLWPSRRCRPLAPSPSLVSKSSQPLRVVNDDAEPCTTLRQLLPQAARLPFPLLTLSNPRPYGPQFQETCRAEPGGVSH